MAVVWRTPGLLAPGPALFKVPGPLALISLSVPCSPPRPSARSHTRMQLLTLPVPGDSHF